MTAGKLGMSLGGNQLSDVHPGNQHDPRRRQQILSLFFPSFVHFADFFSPDFFTQLKKGQKCFDIYTKPQSKFNKKCIQRHTYKIQFSVVQELGYGTVEQSWQNGVKTSVD